MKIRSPALLALSLSLLTFSGALGLLVHDGEVGTTEDTALSGEVGSTLRLRGEMAHPERVPAGFSDSLDAYTVQMMHERLDITILVTSDAELPENGTWIVRGSLVDRDLDQRALLVHADEVDEPILFG